MDEYLYDTIYDEVKSTSFIKVDDETFDQRFDAKINSIYYNNNSYVCFNELYIKRIREKYNAKMKVGDILELYPDVWNINKCPLRYIKSWGKLQFENTSYFNTIVCNTFDAPIYIHFDSFKPSKIINKEDIETDIHSTYIHYSFHNVKEKHIFIGYDMMDYENFIELFEKALDTLLEMVFDNDSVLLTMKMEDKKIVMHEIEEYFIYSGYGDDIIKTPKPKKEIQIGYENDKKEIQIVYKNVDD